jgi:hypothetical protein
MDRGGALSIDLESPAQGAEGKEALKWNKRGMESPNASPRHEGKELGPGIEKNGGEFVLGFEHQIQPFLKP